MRQYPLGERELKTANGSGSEWRASIILQSEDAAEGDDYAARHDTNEIIATHAKW